MRTVLAYSVRTLASNKVRWFLFQLAFLLLFVFVFYYVASNVLQNTAAIGIEIGFRFLSSEAGFAISESLIDYNQYSTYLDAFYVGISNTLYVGFVAIICASILGLIVGIANFSNNWLVRKLAFFYVELFRNIPTLLQILFWHNLLLNILPSVRNSWSFFDCIFINLRGIYLPSPVYSSNFLWVNLMIALAIICLFFLKKIGKNLTNNNEKLLRLLIILIPIFGYFIIGGITFVTPALIGFNFKGGFNVSPEFFALTFALSIYTATYIAEAIRSGISSIPIEQKEGAKSLGLSGAQTLKLIIIPQALRVAIPPIISQYLNVIKNSSLAVAIGYPDLVNVFTGTTLNQVGQALEIIAMTMLVYLFISLIISLLLNLLNHKLKIVEN